jgi:hypothetical protein
MAAKKTAVKTAVKKEQKQRESVWEIEKSKQRGVAVEIHGYGVTSFDPRHMATYGPEDFVGGGMTTFYLTEADLGQIQKFLDARKGGGR